MKRRKQSRQFKEASLKALIECIDKEVEAYVRSGVELQDLPCSDADYRLEALLKEMRKYHPLNVRTRKHGYMLYRKLLNNKHEMVSWLLSDIRSGFDIPYGRSPFRWYTGGLRRIFSQIYERIAEGLQMLYAMSKEGRK